MLNSSVKLAAEMVAAEGVESGDDSGKDGSPQRNSGKMQKKKVIAAAAAKKKKVWKFSIKIRVKNAFCYVYLKMFLLYFF